MSEVFEYTIRIYVKNIGKGQHSYDITTECGLEPPLYDGEAFNPGDSKQVLLMTGEVFGLVNDIFSLLDATDYFHAEVPGRIVAAFLTEEDGSDEFSAAVTFLVEDDEDIPLNIVEEARVFFEESVDGLADKDLDTVVEVIGNWLVDEFTYFQYQGELIWQGAEMFNREVLPYMLIVECISEDGPFGKLLAPATDRLRALEESDAEYYGK